MDKLKLTFFELFSLGWISLATLGLAAAMLGIFSKTFILLAIFGIIALSALLWKKGAVKTDQTNWISISLVMAILLTGLTLSAFTTPTIFGGRDEGSYSTAALQLAKTNSLSLQTPLVQQFFEIYGPGKALNFPGFYYSDDGSLRSQFLPGFTVWVAVCFELFGLAGVALVNLFPLLTFVSSFYLVTKNALLANSAVDEGTNIPGGNRLSSAPRRDPSTFAVLGALFLLTAFPLLLFYKFTLSEIYFGSLAWFSFHLLMKYFSEKSYLHFILVFLPFPLMLFSRIETMGFVVILILILILKDFNRFRWPKYQLWGVLLGLVAAASLAYNSNFFIDTGKNIFQPLFQHNQPASESPNRFLSDDLQNLYLPRVFLNYNFLPFLVMGGLYIIYLLKNRQFRRLLPFVFFLPTLIYLIDANISLDHPWMLRRFVFSILPLFILYTILFFRHISTIRLEWLHLKYVTVSIVFLLLAINLLLLFPGFSLSFNYITFSQNKTLLDQTAVIAQQIGPNDLLLVSQKSSGSGWSLMSEPLRTIYDKQATYFFNPSDLAKINRERFEKIYLLTSESESNLFHDLPKDPIVNFAINNTVIQPSRDPALQTQIEETTTLSTLYLLQ